MLLLGVLVADSFCLVWVRFGCWLLSFGAGLCSVPELRWIPAFAGMTDLGLSAFTFWLPIYCAALYCCFVFSARVTMDPPLQGAPRRSRQGRCAGAVHALRNPCYTLRRDDGFRANSFCILVANLLCCFVLLVQVPDLFSVPELRCAPWRSRPLLTPRRYNDANATDLKSVVPAKAGTQRLSSLFHQPPT